MSLPLQARQAPATMPALDVPAVTRWISVCRTTPLAGEPIRVVCEQWDQRMHIAHVERDENALALVLAEGEYGLNLAALERQLTIQGREATHLPLRAMLVDPFGELVDFTVVGLSTNGVPPTITVQRCGPATG